MSEKHGNARHLLGGLNVLVVEDESIISFFIEDILLTLGCESVWHAGAVAQAMVLLNERRPDAVVLDVNLSGEPAYPLAEELETRGIPFIFATGYGVAGLPKCWVGKPVIQKPFTAESLEAALRAAF